MEFRLFGPLQVAGDDGRSIDLASPTRRSLLAALLLEAGRAVSADSLIEAVWEDRAAATSRSTLRYHVSKLRDALEGASSRGRDLLVTRGPGYCLEVPPEAIDIRRFEGLVRLGRQHLEEEPEQAGRLLAEALDLARGAPLADFTYHDFAAAEIRRLEELQLSALEGRITADLALGRHEAVVDELQGLVVRHPLRERFWARLMVALYRSGRQAEALRAYREAHRILGEELGIETSEELRRLEEQVLLHDPALDGSAADEAERRRLPVRLTSFVGRAGDIAALRRLVEEHRLVTVLGPPGAGKTRLAVEVAERLGADTGWVWFVDLAGQTGPRGILEALAQTVGVVRRGQIADERPTEERLLDFLRRKRALLLLDNCEPVAAEAGAIAGDLLRSCPYLRVLATSRQALGTEGETVWNIPMLGSGPGGGALGNDAFDLFVARAQAADSTFQLQEDDAALVARLCGWLDGLPLAIELAAAQVDVLSLEQMAERLQAGTAAVPVDGRGLLGQERLQSAIGWSCARLAPAEKRLFERLSVCAGRFSLPLVEALAHPEPDPVGLLASLARKSLVAAERSGVGLSYRILEPLRRFGGERLSELGGTDDARRAHAAYCAARAEEAWREWTHWRPPAALGRGDVENLRGALQWLEGHDPQGFVRLAGALGWLWYESFLSEEGWHWSSRALGVEPAPAEDRARVQFAAVLTAQTLDQVKAAAAMSAGVLEHFRGAADRHPLVRALTVYGMRSEVFSLEDPDQARAEAVEIARALGDDRTLGHCLDSRAWGAFAGNDPACIDWWREAEDAFSRCDDEPGWALAAAARISAEVTWGRSSEGDPVAALKRIHGIVSRWRTSSWSVAMLENQLRNVCEKAGDLPQALDHGRRAVQLFEEAGDETWRGLCLGDLGCLHRMAGDLAEARRCLLEATAFFRSIGRFGTGVWLLESLAALLVAAGDLEAGARLLGSAEGIRRAKGWQRPEWDRPDFDAAVGRLSSELGEGRVQGLMEESGSTSLNEALDTAVRRVGLISLSEVVGA